MELHRHLDVIGSHCRWLVIRSMGPIRRYRRLQGVDEKHVMVWIDVILKLFPFRNISCGEGYAFVEEMVDRHDYMENITNDSASSMWTLNCLNAHKHDSLITALFAKVANTGIPALVARSSAP